MGRAGDWVGVGSGVARGRQCLEKAPRPAARAEPGERPLAGGCGLAPPRREQAPAARTGPGGRRPLAAPCMQHLRHPIGHAHFTSSLLWFCSAAPCEPGTRAEPGTGEGAGEGSAIVVEAMPAADAQRRQQRVV